MFFYQPQPTNKFIDILNNYICFLIRDHIKKSIYKVWQNKYPRANGFSICVFESYGKITDLEYIIIRTLWVPQIHYYNYNTMKFEIRSIRA